MTMVRDSGADVGQRGVGIGRAIVVGVVAVALGLLGLRLWASSAPAPETLGPTADGSLAPCPATPNCVASDGSGYEPLAPLPLPDGGYDAVLEALESLPRTTVVTREPPYAHAESRTAIVGYVDDLEVVVDEEAGVVHVRSASRLGSGDLGVNAARVEQLRELLAR